MSSKTKTKAAATKAGRSAPRRSVPPIDTNLNSYSRKDPFLAINVLVKLLSSLHSRIGGSHLKLTPEEHKLSLHLLGIVEPFVGSVPSRRTLITRQPTEILDAIVFHLDLKSDLLNLALTCQRMHDIVVPRHYDYRVVRCKVSSISVWNHLIVNRSLAKNVRRIEILDERTTIAQLIPSGIQVSDTDLESTDDELGMHEKQERYLVSALGKMTALKAFIWSCNHSPISIVNVWPTLLTIVTLSHVEINDNLVFNTTGCEGEGDKKRATVLPELETVTLRSTRHAYGATKHPSLARIKGMLSNCPNLSALDISYSPPKTSVSQLLGQQTGPWQPLPVDDLFLFGRWPRLTSLTLTSLRSLTNTTGWEAVANFLFAHANIEVLNLDVVFRVPFHGEAALLPNTLPKLRELKAHQAFASAILDTPCFEGSSESTAMSESPRMLRPLETIRGVRLDGSIPNTFSHISGNRLLPLLGMHSATLKRLELAGWTELDEIRRLGDYLPNIVWLDVGRNSMSRTRFTQNPSGASKIPIGNVIEWATILSSFPNLTTFHGVKFFYEVSVSVPIHENVSSIGITLSSASTLSLADRSRIRKNDESASLLVWKCPKLRRVDHWEEGGGKVIVLVREAEHKEREKVAGDKDAREKVRWEVRRVKQN